MPKTKFEFINASGHTLAGLLETPINQQTTFAYAVFAHCFTCGKDIAVASRISRALAEQSIAVLRFDFTGLGNSDGDFANTNFSSNVQDLLDAVTQLSKDHDAPTLLIGHSLGGAAVLSAATQIPSVKAVVTIGAPATAEHVQHLFADAKSTLQNQDEANVCIGAREFTIKKQLLDDLNKHASADYIRKLDCALLILHSPADTIVSIDEAGKIYQAAKHPKSFISLDQADHLLIKKADAEYVALTISAWASRYLANTNESNDTKPLVAKGEVLVTELDKKFLRQMYSDSHTLLADEPVSYGGSNLGPTPYELLLMSLGSCTSMTMRMYANHKKLLVDNISVRLKHEKIHAKDCEDCEETNAKIDRITRYIDIEGDISPEQEQRLLEIADRCPVHRTLENHPQIITEKSK